MFRSRALRKFEELYRNIIDNVSIGVSLISPKMEIMALNKQMKEWFPEINVSKKPICYKSFNNPPKEERCSYCPTCKTLEDGQVHEAVSDTPAGKEIKHYRIISSPIKDKRGRIVAAIEMVDDITRRVKIEKELFYRVQVEKIIDRISAHFINLKSEEIDNGIIEALETIGKFSGVDRCCVFLLSLDRTKLEVTHQWCAKGIDPQYDRFKGISLDAFPWFAEKIKNYEIIHIPDISTLEAQASTEKLEFQSQKVKSIICVPMIASGILSGVLRFDSLRTKKTWSREDARLLKIIGEIFVNVLERKRAEDELKRAYQALQGAQEKLIQTEKLAALGRFSSGVAHEVRNPLGIILGAVEYLERVLNTKDKDVKVTLDKLKISTLRAENIVQSLLKYSKPSDLKAERVQPMDLIKETLSLITYRAPLRNVEIKTQFADRTMYVDVDRTQIQQVLFNVMNNAIEAIDESGGVVDIKTYSTSNSPLSSESTVCVIEIQDSGSGIPKNDLSRIFEPFFTTKRDRKGTGLGLSISKKIIDNHNGTMLIESQEKKGTTVKIILPII